MITGARATLALGLITLSLLAGCGLRGPLYLPDRSEQAATPAGDEDAETRKRRTPPRPAPQSQKEDAAAPAATSDPDRSANPPPPAPPPKL